MGESYYDYPACEEEGDGFKAILKGAVANPKAPNNTIAVGIDLSRHNGTSVKNVSDMAVLAKSVDFVILRCGYGQDLTSQDDSMFETYVKACRDLNLPYGVYLYSYAKSATGGSGSDQGALGEAEHTLRLLNKCKEWGYEPSLPIFFDMEDSSQASLSASVKAQIARTYCERLEAAGYATGIYANLYWWNNYLKDPWFSNVTKWVAQYNDSFSYSGKACMWQASETAVLPGLSGAFDLNYLFYDISTNKCFKALSLNRCAIGTPANQIYTGGRLTPNIPMTFYGQPLGLGIDYILNYANNIAPGRAIVAAYGVGRFSGSVMKSFVILPKATKISKIKSAKKAGTVYYKNVAGASGYQLAWRLKSKTTWSYANTTKLSKKLSKLAKKKAYLVLVRPYVVVDGVMCYGPWSPQKKFTTK